MICDTFAFYQSLLAYFGFIKIKATHKIFHTEQFSQYHTAEIEKKVIHIPLLLTKSIELPETGRWRPNPWLGKKKRITRDIVTEACLHDSVLSRQRHYRTILMFEVTFGSTGKQVMITKNTHTNVSIYLGTGSLESLSILNATIKLRQYANLACHRDT